jgi:hypothetical protein
VVRREIVDPTACTGNAGLLQVLACWFHGYTTESMELWGISMVWVGRVGKIVQVSAATFVIADLVGGGTVQGSRRADAR